MEQLREQIEQARMRNPDTNESDDIFLFEESELFEMIETAMRDAYNEARNQTPYIDFDDYFSQIKETLINK